MHWLLLLAVSAPVPDWHGWENYAQRYPLSLKNRPGKTYYVRRAKGDDFADGSSRTMAFKSVKRACEVAEPGDTVIVGKGDYVEQLSPTNGGRFPDATILFFADVDGVFTGDAGPVRLISEHSTPILLDQATGIEIIGFQIVARIQLPDQRREPPKYLEFVGVEMLDSSAIFRCCEIVGAETGVLAKRSLVRFEDCQIRGASKSAISSENSQCWVVGGRLRDNVGPAVLARTADPHAAVQTNHNEKPIQPLRELAKKEFSVQLQRCQVDNNRGGGLISLEVPTAIDGCVIQNNGRDAILADGAPQLIVRDSLVLQNAGRGCVTLGNGKNFVERSVLRGNHEWGVESKNADIQITNCLVVDNGQGINIASQGRLIQASIWHATVANNRGQVPTEVNPSSQFSSYRNHCFGVLQQGGELEVVNSIIAANGQFGLHRYSGILKHHHNLVHGHEENFFGTEQGDFELIAEPRFVNAAEGNYELRRNSRAINLATDPGQRATFDLIGNERVLHRRADVGCFEFPGQPGVRAILRWEEIGSNHRH